MITYEQLKSKMLKELDISHLSVEEQDKILAEMGKVIMQRIALNLIKNVPEEKRDEFKELYSSGDLTKIDEFLKLHIPDADEIVAGTIRMVVDTVKK